MKALDLFLREIPKHGGWPKGADYCVFDAPNNSIMFSFNNRPLLRSLSYGWTMLGANCSFLIGTEIEMATPVVVTDWDRRTVSRAEYMAYSRGDAEKPAAGEKPAVDWDGEGMPPVGCECELFGMEEWIQVRIKFVGENVVVVDDLSNPHHGERLFHLAKHPGRFRPIRTEADRKREEAGLAIYHAINWNADGEPPHPTRLEDYRKAYDAIAAGKIPGVKLAE